VLKGTRAVRKKTQEKKKGGGVQLVSNTLGPQDKHHWGLKGE